MIFDQISSPTAAWLERQHPVWSEALAWIRAMPADFPNSISELRGPAVYVNVHGYATLAVDACRWESHRHTIDVQYCIAGGEVIDWLPVASLPENLGYNADKDTDHWNSTNALTTSLEMNPGTFVVFFPGELHRPKRRIAGHDQVRKLVVKIQADVLAS